MEAFEGCDANAVENEDGNPNPVRDSEWARNSFPAPAREGNVGQEDRPHGRAQAER